MKQQGRRDRILEPERGDTYRNRGKLSEPTVCKGCGSLFQGGRWSWDEAPPNAARAVCPACQRIADRLPAGEVTIQGPFFSEHRAEIMNLVHNEEAAEKREHPLERIMAVEEADEGTLVTTTGIHLARRIGESLARSYQGAFDFRYADGEQFIRVAWSR